MRVLKKSVFVDTSFWFSLMNKKDRNNKQAISLFQAKIYPCVTSNFVVDEIVTLVRNRLGFSPAEKLGDKFFNSEIAEVIHISHEIERKTWQIFKKYSDKGFSLTDCTSFVVIDKCSIPSIYAFDKHFDQYHFKFNSRVMK